MNNDEVTRLPFPPEYSHYLKLSIRDFEIYCTHDYIPFSSCYNCNTIKLYISYSVLSTQNILGVFMDFHV